MNFTTTERGFNVLKFEDRYDVPCSLQESSLATEPAIWFGVDKADPIIMHSDADRLGIKTDANHGWVKYPIPKEVFINTRMHLSQQQVIDLLPHLQKFAETGQL